MASSQSFSMIQRRISLSPPPASPVNSGEPLKTMAMRLPPSCGAAFCQHVLEEEERAVVHARGTRAEASAEAKGIALLSRCSVCCCFHSTPKGGLASM